MSDEKLKPELPKELNLKTDFKAPSYDDWREKVEKDLKGVPFEKKLITKTYEGIDLQPIYTKNDLENLEFINEMPGEVNFARGKNVSGYLKNGWEICQDIPYPLPEDFNDALLNDLSRGQNSISIPLDEAAKLGLDADNAEIGQVGKNGVSISSLKNFKRALNEINITKYPIHINAGFSSLPILTVFAAYLIDQNIDKKKVRGSITADIISYLVDKGELPVSIDNLINELKLVSEWANEKTPGLKTIGVSGLPYHNAGASAVQELAYTLASGVEYIHKLSDKGLGVNLIAKQMRFTFGVGSFFFMEVAKFRAAKMLWSKITEAFGVDEENRKMTIHARTGMFTQTKFDPYVNMLRTTTEAFSAVVGGIDSLHTNTFDELFGLPDQFSRRIARNTQIILDEESHLTNLIDPAGGSFFVEKLTDEIAKTAWKEFQVIEKKGGILKTLEEGYVQSEIEKVWEARKKDISKRKAVIVGTNMYANIKEEIKQKNEPDYENIKQKLSESVKKQKEAANKDKFEKTLSKLKNLYEETSMNSVDAGAEAVLEGATIGEISKTSRSNAGNGITIKKLKQQRAAEFFETLRDKADKIKEKRGSRPKVFLAAMGPIKQYKARADFSQGFFEVGGFEIEYPRGFDSTEDAVEAANNSKADVVVICSTDETYPELVPPIAKEIKEKNENVTVVLAGYPKEQIEEHKKSGVNEFIYLGCDAFELIEKLLTKISNNVK